VLSTTTLDDTDPAFTYDAHWAYNGYTGAGTPVAQCYNATVQCVCPHRRVSRADACRHSGAATQNATAALRFTGSALALYGATAPGHGAFAVALDGGAPVRLNGTAPAFRPQTLLVRAAPPRRSAC
jgi:hypothetical protein